jgi:hypothetical protein
MPNYCENTLDITCPREAFNKLQPLLFAKATERDATDYPSVNKELMFFSFTALLPTPPELCGKTAPASIVTEEERQKFFKERDMNNNLFHCSEPITKEMSKDFIERFGHNNWYFWNIDNWGTKWDADVYHIESNLLTEPNSSEVTIKVCFSTAWSPPTNWFNSLCDMLRDDEVSMEIRYSESGMGFAGTHYFNSGERWDAEGSIHMVQDSTGSPVTYNEKTDGWRNDKGQFVAQDDIREEYEYDSE